MCVGRALLSLWWLFLRAALFLRDATQLVFTAVQAELL